MKPTFTIKLNQPVFSGLVVTGKFDGRSPSIAAATTGGKVILHSPHDQTVAAEGASNPIKFLNLNRKITSLAAGKLGDSNDLDQPDLLFVGTQSNLLAYDVERNADRFFVDVQDGVNSLAIGKIGNRSSNMVIAGGNCSIFGFDQKGTEAFWTVTGDNVASLALSDVTSNNPALLVGSDDFEIRVFRGEEMTEEITEADRVNLLHPLEGPMFAYGLANGTVGVYTNTKTRLWRVKTKNKPTALLSHDIDLDGIPEIFSGWSHGGFNVRRRDNGDVIFRDMMDAPIASILKSDYRMDGNEEVMICSEAGTIYGYLPTDTEFGELLDSGIGKENAADQKALDELHTQKLELINELRNLEKAGKMTKATTAELPVGALPANTSLNYQLYADLDLKAVALRVEVTTDVQIVNLIAVDLEGVILVDREAIAITPRAQSKWAILPLRPNRNAPCKLRVQSHIATRSLGAQIHVFETDINIPKFSAFAQLTEDLSQFTAPTGNVKFTCREPIDRFIQWFSSSFLLRQSFPNNPPDRLKVGFLSVCRTKSGLDAPANNHQKKSSNRRSSHSYQPEEGELLIMSLVKSTEAGQGVTKVKISCDNIELAADIIQDLSKYFNWDELESEADFPSEFEKFDVILKNVAEYNSTRINLTADMAEESQRIKALIIRAEDSRLMLDMDNMRRSYTELSTINNTMITHYNIRSTNHENLLNALKEVNQMIQKAANLRVGKPKTRAINDCRQAVKANDLSSLFRIIKHGYEPSNVYSK